MILDGAMGTLLPEESQHHALWSTHCVISNPEAILEIHKSYISQGADVIQTSTYQTSSKLSEWFPKENYAGVIKKSVDIAYMAAKGKAFIAGSVGPYGASLSNGAEYTGEYGGITDANLEEFHKERLDILYNDNRVDIIALETIPSQQEIKVLTQMMRQRQKPYYISLSVKGNLLADGSSLEEFSPLLLEANLVGVNCLSPIDSLLWLQKLKPLGIPMCVYPNSGEVYQDRHWRSSEQVDQEIAWEDYIGELYALGNVKLIGGCCRTTPDTIAEMRKVVDLLY